MVRSDHVYPTRVKFFYLSTRRVIDVSPFPWLQRYISWRFNVPLTLYNFNPNGNKTAKPVTIQLKSRRELFNGVCDAMSRSDTLASFYARLLVTS